MATNIELDINTEQSRAALLREFPGAKSDLDRYLNLEPHRFAVIKVGGNVINNAEQLTATAYDVARLQSLGLYPVMLHGGGRQIDEALENEGLSTEKRDGLRVTHQKHMSAVAAGLAVVSSVLCETIEEQGGKVVAISDIFTATLGDPQNLGSVDKVVEVDTSKVEDAAAWEATAVVSCIGHQLLDGTEQPVNINGDISGSALAVALGSLKYISLTPKGGITEKGQKLDNLAVNQARSLIEQHEITDGARIKVEEALRLFNGDNDVHDVVITSPLALMQELFTEKGAGTLIHKED